MKKNINVLKAVCLISAFMIASVANAAHLVANFESDLDGPLTGQITTSGQMWETFELWSGPTTFDANYLYGLNFTMGAGTDKDIDWNGTGEAYGNTTALDVTLTTGIILVEMDMQTQRPDMPSGGASEPVHQFWLRDPVSGETAAITLSGANSNIGFQGLGITEAALNPVGIGMWLGSIHVRMEIDLDNKTVSYSWYDNANPAEPLTSGSIDVGSYTVDFAPKKLDIYGYGQGGVIACGFDNIMIMDKSEFDFTLLDFMLVADDFEGNSGNLVDQQADTGQTYYAAWGAGSLQYNTTTVTEGVQGAGTTVEAGAAAAVSFTTQTTGILRMEADLMDLSTLGTWNASTGGALIMLEDTVNLTTLTVGMWTGAGVKLQGITPMAPTPYLEDASSGADLFNVRGGISFVLDIDLVNKLVDFSWQGFSPETWVAGTSGSVSGLSYTGTFNPNMVLLFGAGSQSGQNYGGIDNLKLYKYNCEAVIGLEYHIAGDLNGDCYVDIDDIEMLSSEWLNCMQPDDAACQ